jgi:hypothetical protein
MKPLHHTGDSSNIAFYAAELSLGEEPAPGDVWAEVLRSDHTGPTLKRRKVPVFHFRVESYSPRGRVAEFTYEPKARPATFALSDRTVNKLVQEALKGS